jgi:hypothetical protein
MKKVIRCLPILSAVVFSVVLVSAALAAGEETAGKNPADKLLDIGASDAKGIQLKAWIGKPVKGADPAEMTPIHMTVSKEAYVAAFYVSPQGYAVVLLPSKENPDHLFKPGKEYTLFGYDSKAQLEFPTDKKGASIVFYASAKPWNMAPLKFAEGKAFITIPEGASAEMRTLTGIAEGKSREEGFARAVVALERSGGPLTLMGLPGGVKTRVPESTYGAQGLKEGPKTGAE